jgi:hypothetical protein
MRPKGPDQGEAGLTFSPTRRLGNPGKVGMFLCVPQCSQTFLMVARGESLALVDLTRRRSSSAKTQAARQPTVSSSSRARATFPLPCCVLFSAAGRAAASKSSPPPTFTARPPLALCRISEISPPSAPPPVTCRASIGGAGDAGAPGRMTKECGSH